MYKELETNRLLIRPITLQDKEFILTLVNTQGWLKFIGNRNIKNSSEAEKYIQTIIENKNFYYNVFEIKETKYPIGMITFLNRGNQKFPDIGFALLPQYEKKGYTYEAGRRYLDEIITQKICTKVLGITMPENVNSIKLLERLGLVFQHNFSADNETLALYSITI